MTSGGDTGISGIAPSRAAWLAILGAGAAVTLVNITSHLLEADRRGEELHPIEPITWEVSSFVCIMALLPLVNAAMHRVPPKRDRLARFVLIHAALTVPFSLLHVAGMVTVRHIAYWLWGEPYDFLGDSPALTLIYEWRKDALTYSILASVFWYYQRQQARRAPLPPEQPGDNRIEIRDGGAAVFLAPADILFVEAAGNYVEFHTSARKHLVRGTLAAWEARLTARGFVRVHRSRLVNRARIAAIKPTPSGDVEITLDDGRAFAGSRRYRSALESAAAQT